MPVYKPPINTVEEMLETDMDLAVAADSAPAALLGLDPRPKMQKLRNRQLLYPFLHGRAPGWLWKRQEHETFELMSKPIPQLFSRMYEERVMLLVGRSDKLINEEKFHLGDEVLFSSHSSPMVPKESPMKVI